MAELARGIDERTSTALWYVGGGRCELRRATAAGALGDGEVLVVATHGAVSRGTESLVLQGLVPASEHERMRCPHMDGHFDFPCKYGYVSVGVVEACGTGAEALVGRRVFCLHPHEDRYVVPQSWVNVLPEGTPSPRAVLAPNLETAVNVVWDAKISVGDRVAVVGAGGIGFDVSEYLAHGDSAAGGADEPHHPQLDDFLKEWSIDGTNSTRGGLLPPAGAAAANGGGGAPPPAREITFLQRKRGKHGAGLGKTTGWIHRASLKARHVTMLGGVSYVAVDDDGLHVKLKDGTPHVLDVESIVVCAGQTPLRELQAPLSALGVPVYLIGGAHEAGELDAKRAIDQGSRLAADIERAKPDRVGEYVAPLGMEGWLFQQITSRSKSA